MYHNHAQHAWHYHGSSSDEPHYRLYQPETIQALQLMLSPGLNAARVEKDSAR